ncbi:hypothetical protein BCW_5318 [Bacillus cereus W]|uniref:Uncharacterized protein n=1 Tax=Bacillus cereus (strain AH820) TaxID=405535 RepID=B7JIF3_BACC0|nr:hypothetical protein BCAH820_5532 [Bacillus cereus AH820]ACP13661.1 hypothetical protein BAMEG_5734 [Bacillus anthracis str. CDC 684]ACQ47583.1 hypothetical protein BAA_5717 [Bacillus anthracis str. A0248]AEW58553.1 Hypothetical protein bcf_27300 [Bacillus cereus F837/76]EDR86023.1 hypothetical protein BAQ_5712 [Bacillus anthracis str. A0193]EDR91149.1 hypothetical protein BAH_5733 [Bacillus anthracis str. A0442]EDS95319.1 hypothetical protein BAK_5780 [Bacillus anthracis str. A0389]EDT17
MKWRRTLEQNKAKKRKSIDFRCFFFYNMMFLMPYCKEKIE